jgi:hypothetical protein
MMILGTDIQQRRVYASSSINPTSCPANTAFEVTLQAVLVTLPQGTILCMAGNFSPQTITAIPPPGSYLLSIRPTWTVVALVQPESNGVCPPDFRLATIRSGIEAIPVSAGMCVQLL